MEKYDFGNKLYEYRTQKGLTQKELGKLLGVTDKAVSKWETGESKPRLDKMNQITELFETSIDGMLGKETADGEQLKPYKTIFEARLEKFSKNYKAVRIWTYFFAIICVIMSALSYTFKILNGELATEENSYLIGTILITSATVIFTLIFKPKFNECKSRDMNIFMIFSLLLFLFSCIFPVISAVKLGRVIEEYDSFTIGFICIEALILTVIALVSLYKKKYHFFTYTLFSILGINFVVFELLYFLIEFALAAQFDCFNEKRNWLALANKANIEFKKADEEQKAKNVFIAIVAIMTVLGIAVSFFSPYITYKMLMAQYFPEYKPYKIIDYDYSAKADEEFTDIEFQGAKLKIPKGYKKSRETEESVVYKNDRNDLISVSFSPDSSLYFDESDIESLEPDEAEKVREQLAKEKIVDSLCKKHFGVSTDTHYGLTYVLDFVDLRDVKFYETQKAVFMGIFAVMKSVADTGAPMSASLFDDGLYCGIVEGRQMRTNVHWTADVWYSNNKEGAYYNIVYLGRNSTDITDNQMICKLVNSLEF